MCGSVMRPHLHKNEEKPEIERYRTRSYQIVIKIANKNLTACREKVTGFYEYLTEFSISVLYNVHREVPVKLLSLCAKNFEFVII